jgi:hypothetical protein
MPAPAQPRPPAAAPRLDLSLSRRDLSLFLLGVGTGAVGAFLGRWLAVTVRGEKPRAPEGDADRP